MNEHEERMMDVALEEILGGTSPPAARPGGGDRVRRAGPGRKAALAVAAALLCCLGVLWSIYREGIPPHDPDTSELTYRLLVPEGFTGDCEGAFEQARRVVERRLRERQMAGAEVRVVKRDRLVIRFSPPDREAFEDCKRLIRRPGRLGLHAVATQDLQERFNRDGSVPAGYRAIDVPAGWHRTEAEFEPWNQPRILIRETPIIEGKNIARSEPRSEVVPGGVRWVTGFELDADGAGQFDEAAKVLYRQWPPGMIAIVLDGVLRSAAAVQTDRFGGQGVITGARDEAEARDLSIILKSGALPVPLKPESERFVPAKK
jgi:preprotein translocase subunit SecD